MKQAYIKVYDICGYDWVLVEPTGVCKKVIGGPQINQERHYIQIQKRIFGIPFGKYWVEKSSVKFCDPIEETVYVCNCGENT